MKAGHTCTYLPLKFPLPDVRYGKGWPTLCVDVIVCLNQKSDETRSHLKNYLYLFNWCIITLQLCRSSRHSLGRVDVIEPCLTCELPAVSGLRRPHAGHSPLVICVRDRGEHWPPMSLGHLAPRHRVTSTGARGQTERGLEVQKKTCAFRGCSVFCGPF